MINLLSCFGYACKLGNFFHPATGGTRDAELAKRKYVFFSGDPGGIGFAFHRAGAPEKIYAIRYLSSKPLKNDSKFLNFSHFKL